MIAAAAMAGAAVAAAAAMRTVLVSIFDRWAGALVGGWAGSFVGGRVGGQGNMAEARKAPRARA